MADKYSMISFVPSVVLVGIMIVGTFAAISFIKKNIAKDAALAAQRND
ncbi:hypothetical protein [Amphritea balenae]|nr:hypothetical protein [Amphritea balenae]